MKKIILFITALILAIPQISIAGNPSNPNCDSSSYPAVVLSAIENEDNILLSWNKITHNDLLGYKVVISKNNQNPVYPANGYLKWITNTNINSYKVDNSDTYRNGDFGSYLKQGENYYFSITAVYKCGSSSTSIAGNALKINYSGNIPSTDNNNNATYPNPVVSLTSNTSGVLVNWEKINDSRFTGYKVVVSKSVQNPVYPANGYAVYITTPNTNSYLIDNSRPYHNGDFGNYLKPGENYYFSVTALYSNQKSVGNSLEATYNGPGHQSTVKPKEKDPLLDMENKARQLLAADLGEILGELQKLRNIIKEQENEIKYLQSLISDLGQITENIRNSLNQFITYGVDENTLKLGAGERAAVVHSYKSAFKQLPENESELTDIIRIANGRWPSKTNEEAEKRASNEFRRIYLREANISNPHDNAAVTIMAYGLRQRAENRNLESEKEGIRIFKNIYNKLPKTTEDWNIMQAITYSGATR